MSSAAITLQQAMGLALVFPGRIWSCIQLLFPAIATYLTSASSGRSISIPHTDAAYCAASKSFQENDVCAFSFSFPVQLRFSLNGWVVLSSSLCAGLICCLTWLCTNGLGAKKKCRASTVQQIRQWSPISSFPPFWM